MAAESIQDNPCMTSDCNAQQEVVSDDSILRLPGVHILLLASYIRLLWTILLSVDGTTKK